MTEGATGCEVGGGSSGGSSGGGGGGGGGEDKDLAAKLREAEAGKREANKRAAEAQQRLAEVKRQKGTKAKKLALTQKGGETDDGVLTA